MAEFVRLGVSRETIERLSEYHHLLRKWQSTINLVSAASLEEAWQRHFLDSAQLAPLLPAQATNIIDVGSGAGFPGLVLALLQQRPVMLVESDARKCAFLREAARITNANVTIMNRRVESLAENIADVVTARAFAPLEKLVPLAERILNPEGTLLLPKGRHVESELTAIRASWTMQCEIFPSLTDKDGAVLRVSHIARRTVTAETPA